MPPRTLGSQQVGEHGVYFWDVEWHPRPVYGAFVLEPQILRSLRSLRSGAPDAQILDPEMLRSSDPDPQIPGFPGFPGSSESLESHYLEHVTTSVRNHEGAMDK